MQIVINTRGSYLRKHNNCFLVRNEDRVFEVSADKVDSILITTSASISTDAIEFAVAHNIDIVFLDSFGNPYGRVWHVKLGSTTRIRRQQLEIGMSPAGLALARSWVEEKMANQIEFMKDLRKNRPACKEFISDRIEAVKDLVVQVHQIDGKIDAKRGMIMGLEGMASVHYFAVLSAVLPERWRFEGRSRDPAQDAFNCLLNYGYGVLYSQVEKGCIISGLDPYVGILHTDNYNKKSFVFDLIECFRVYVDRPVMMLFIKKKVQESLFNEVPGGVTLNKEGKAVLIGAVNESFDREVPYRGRKVKVRNMIPLECHRIANHMIAGGERI